MPYCCAFGCRNNEKSGVSFFLFPKDSKMRRIWVSKVKRKHWSPTLTTVLCSDHFENGAYDTDPELLKSLGFRKKPRLRKEAIPTLFSHVGVDDSQSKRRSASEKRQRQQVVNEMVLAAEQKHKSSDSGEPQTEVSHPSTADLGEETSLLTASALFATPGASALPSAEHEACSHLSFGVQANVSMADKSLQTQSSFFPGIKKYSRGTQVSPSQHCVGTQCNLLIQSVTRGTQYEPQEEFVQLVDSDDEMETDPDYDFIDVSDDAEMDTDDDMEFEEVGVDLEDGPSQNQRKFIVFESCLRTLLLSCFLCLGPCRVIIKQIRGSFACFEQICVNGHRKMWDSQPFKGAMPAGNLLMALGIFVSGSSAVRTLNMYRHVNIPTISMSTFYLVPAVRRLWRTQKTSLTTARQGTPLSVGGDARCCSPGHTAKYGSYTLMDLKTSKVLDMQLVQSNQVKKSNSMELAGLKLGMKSLSENGLTVESITTDRHLGVKKYIREEQPTVQHWFDVWHVAKGIKKKILAKGKRKDCNILSEWARSISNHVYWCAASSDGDAGLVRAKWLSVTRHVVNEHAGHGDLYPECEHALLEDRKWILKGSKPHKELELIVSSKHLLNDIGRLSPSEQTSSLESYHKVVTFFAPKSVHYPYATMEARLLLAVIHFNENSNRAQAITEGGQSQWRVSYPKARQGDPVVKPVKVPITFDYVHQFIAEVLDLRQKYPSYRLAEVLAEERNLPPPIASQYEKPAKDLLVGAHRCRFNLTK